MDGVTDTREALAALHQWMPLEEAMRLASIWTDGVDLDNAPQWKAAIKVLAEEVAALATQPAQPSAQGECRNDGRCQYAIDHGAEGLGHCPKGKCAMPQPSAQGEAMAHTSERHFALREAHCIAAGDAFWAARPGTADDARRIAFDAGFVRGFDAGEKVYASAPAAPAQAVPLNFDQLQQVMSQHFGGRELTDDEADSAEAFARAIERAHGIKEKKA